MIVIEVRIARGRLSVAVSEQATNHRQRFPFHRRMTRERVPKVMNSNPRQPRSVADRRPVIADAQYRLAQHRVPKQLGHALGKRGLKAAL